MMGPASRRPAGRQTRILGGSQEGEGTTEPQSPPPGPPPPAISHVQARPRPLAAPPARAPQLILGSADHLQGIALAAAIGYIIYSLIEIKREMRFLRELRLMRQ